MSKVSIACPHCLSGASTRSSAQATPLVRDLWLQCTNLNCGHTFVAQLSIVRTLSPSNTPRAGIVLPVAKTRPRNRPGEFIAANDNESIGAVAESLGPPDLLEA